MPPRIALFETGFAHDGAVREFLRSEVSLLRDYVPAAIVAPLHFALMLADQKQSGALDIPELSHSVVVLTTFDDTPLANRHRDLLWRAFGVPVFEQLRREDGWVIARECEVHDGLHLDSELTAPGLESWGEIVREHCECGAESPRLRPAAAKVMLAAAS